MPPVYQRIGKLISRQFILDHNDIVFVMFEQGIGQRINKNRWNACVEHFLHVLFIEDLHADDPIKIRLMYIHRQVA
ncbi:hypothetical protein D3C72_2470950 [compost metagenome]